MERPGEQVPQKQTVRTATAVRRNPETFGIDPLWWEREMPDAIRRLAPLLRKDEEDAGAGDAELREAFAPVYGEAKVEADLAEVRRLEDVFEREDNHESRVARVYARTLELIIQDMADDWFAGAAASRASKFDDLKRKTDLFLSVPDADGEMRPLAVDVTGAMEAARTKVRQVRESYDHGKFHDVEYFVPEDGSPPAGRTEMPRVIVGASRFGIAQLARLYAMVRIPEARPEGMSREEAAQRLRWHELGGQLYEEIIHQVEGAYETFRALLKSTPTFQETRRAAYKQRAQYLDQVRRALKSGHAKWAKGREEFVRRNEALARELAAPPNNVLEAILE